MIDQSFIQVKSGKGGDGAISGRREKYVPRGGPDGGDGGRGGSVFIYSDPNVNTLLDFRYRKRFAAGNGGNGAGGNKHGKNAEDVYVAVPVGTQVWTEDNPVRLLADLTEPGQKVQVARGGRGGRGNARFASSTNQFPLLAEAGEEGEELSLRLELKLLADVGIIGKPNAGKSSLISLVSAARPRVADYPFTTLEPVLGVVQRHDKTFVMVDIPGMIDGAHQGVGLGHDFLRHVERTRVLVHMVDGSAEDPLEDYRQINDELRLYAEDLTEKPQIVAVNKIDITEARERIPELKASLSDAGAGSPVYFVSAATGEGVDTLLDRTLQVLQEATAVREPAQAEGELEELPVLRPQPRRRGFEVYKEDGDYVVSGSTIERIARRIDTDDWAARMQFYGYLQRVGVVRALEEAGVLPGDTVRIGDMEWEWD